MGSADPHDVPTLRDLIQRHIDRTGQSMRQIGEHSGVRHQTLSNWAAGEITEFPDPERIRRFASYTGYSEQTVVLAAAATIGLRVAAVGGQLVNSLPPGTDNLSVEDIDAIRAIVRQLVDARRSVGRVPVPDLGSVEGLRLEEDDPVSRNQSHTPKNGPVS